MEKIIITGTKGFIGSNLKKELSNKYEIIEINEDVFNTVSWREEISKYFWLDISAVFHVGACSNTLETNVNYIMLVNYEFTKHLSDLCLTNNVPMIYSSSAANYGTNGEHPSNLYGWSKYVGEGYVVANGGIGLRYFNVYGPRQPKRGSYAPVIGVFSRQKKANQLMTIVGDGLQTRDYVHVSDVVAANLAASEESGSRASVSVKSFSRSAGVRSRDSWKREISTTSIPIPSITLLP